MNSKKVVDSKLWLKTISSNSLPLDIEFARISMLNFKISDLTAILIVFIEYAQLISQCILFNPSMSHNSTYSDGTFVRTTVFLAKLLNPGHFLEKEKTGALTVTILIALICSTFAKLFLLSYIIYIAKNKLKGHSTFVQLWKWIFRFQAKVLYFFISSFWTNTIFLIKDGDFDVFGIGKKATIAVSAVFISIEFILASALQIHFSYTLPEKMLFSAKSNINNTITLFQKFLIQILQVTLPTNTLGTDWIMSIINLCLSLLRSSYFFTKLPLYRIKALIFDGGLLAAVLSINLIQSMQAIMRSLDTKNSILFLLVSWIIVSLLIISVSQNYLKQSIIKILKNSSPEFVAHKIIFMKETLKFSKRSNSSSVKKDWYYFLEMTITVNIHKILRSSTLENNQLENLNCKTELNQLILNHLQYTTDTFPKDNFIKLYLAYFYGIKLKSFGNAIRLIKEANLEESQLTLSLLIQKIQDISISLHHQQQNTTKKINLNTYLENIAFANHLEENILGQTQTQIELYQQVASDTPDLAKIFNNAQKIQTIRRVIEKDLSFLENNLSQANIHSFLLYAEYQSQINHSIKDSLHFQKLYQKRYQKYSKYFDQDELNEYNIYQSNTAFVILEAQKQDYGRIVYCSQAFQDIYGVNSQLCIGTNISSYIPPSLRTNNTLNDQSYGYSQEGYLIPVNVVSDIFPIITHGLYTMMIIRPISLSSDYLLVRENGDIESMTKNIAKKLGFPSPLSTMTSLMDISQELAKVNQAFNSQEEILSQNEGNIVELTPLNKDSSKTSLSYHCSFKTINSTTRLISLKEIDQNDNTCSEIQIKPTAELIKETIVEESHQIQYLDTLNPLKPFRSPSVMDTLMPPFMGETVFTTLEDNLFSPKSDQGLIKETIISHTNITSEKKVKILEPRVENEKVISVTNTSLSRNSEKQRVEEAFKAALKVKYYPRSWFCLFLMFYLGIMTVFAIQLGLKVLLEKDFTNFVLKKEILTDSQTRNFLLLALQLTIRIIFNLAGDSLTTLGGMSDVFLSSVKSLVLSLDSVSSSLMKNTNLLEEDLREAMFAPNVRVYNSEEQDFIKINTFQATSSVIETTLKITGLIDQGQENEAIPVFTILERNSLNDLLIETEKISATSLESVINQSNSILSLLDIFLGVILAWMLCMLVSFAFILRKLYLEEKTNLIAVTKLKKSALKKILHDMQYFQRKLSSSQNVSSEKEKSMSHTTSRPNSKGLRKIYIKYFAILLVSVIPIVVLAVANSATIKHSLNTLQEQQALFIFSYQTMATTALGFISAMELFSSNNTLLIKNQKPLDQIQNQIITTEAIRVQGLKSLATGKSSILTPEIQTLMFGDACELFSKDATSVLYCAFLSSSGISPGLFQMMITLENYLIETKRYYLASNKSEEALKEIAATQTIFIIMFEVIVAECNYFNSFLSQSFQELLDNAQRNRNWIFGVFASLLVIQSFFFWVTVLSRLKQANSQFKNVLQVFPSRLVLSNFLLKILLVNTSKGLLSLSIKSDL